MFSTDELIADCRDALQNSAAERVIQQIARRAVSNGAQVARALGTPSCSGIFSVYQSAELTILKIVWAPGMWIHPHDHRMWAVIAVYEGREENTFYERTAAGLLRTRSTSVFAGDAVLLDANVIHAVTNPLRRFTAALQIYGGDFFNAARSEFDPATLAERPFDIERAKAAFVDANQRPSADVVAPVQLA